jgi:hypothetical protein
VSGTIITAIIDPGKLDCGMDAAVELDNSFQIDTGLAMAKRQQ